MESACGWTRGRRRSDHGAAARVRARRARPAAVRRSMATLRCGRCASPRKPSRRCRPPHERASVRPDRATRGAPGRSATGVAARVLEQPLHPRRRSPAVRIRIGRLSRGGQVVGVNSGSDASLLSLCRRRRRRRRRQGRASRLHVLRIARGGPARRRRTGFRRLRRRRVQLRSRRDSRRACMPAQGSRRRAPVRLAGRACRDRSCLPRPWDRVDRGCAQALGTATCAGKVGMHGDFGCFSFYPTKNLGALGDAGAIWVREAAQEARLRALRNHGAMHTARSSHPALTAGLMNCRRHFCARSCRISSAGSTRVAGSRRSTERRWRGSTFHRHKRSCGARLQPVRRPAGAARRAARMVGRTRSGDASLLRIAGGCPPGAETGARCAQAERNSRQALALPMYPELDLSTARSVGMLVATFVREQHGEGRQAVPV